ncbi:MAG: MFS transporter, partial [Archaeoglobaceae archaeon]
GYGYKESFLFLFFPSLLAVIFLYLAKKEFKFEVSEKIVLLRGSLNFYLLFTLFSISGLVNFQLIAFHLENKAIFGREMIPVLYAMAMGVDAISALVSGRMYDRFGLKTLFAVPLLTPLSVSLSFSFPPLGIFLFGIILGMQESVMRAAIASVSEAKKRATAYGVFNTVMGFGFFLGGIAFGFLYPDLQLMTLYSILCEILAIVFLIKVMENKS